MTPVLTFSDASLELGGRMLWSGLNLHVEAGEFLAVLGSNGTGKTSLLKAILGQQHLTGGSISFLGEPVRRGNERIGYIPQQKLIEGGTPLRARDLVALGVNGRRWGLPVSTRAEKRRVDELLNSVGASDYADAPVATLSGGEQQRVRVAQSIAADPALLLCDEPLLSLDLAHQREVSDLIASQRERSNAAIVFVTHDVNPILDHVDRVLYLAGRAFTVGTPADVLTTETLTELYGTPVDVIRSRGRIVVVGGPEVLHHEHLHGAS